MNSLRASTVLNWTLMNLIRPDDFSFREIHEAVRKSANHPACKHTYTVTVSDQIKALIKNEVISAKRKEDQILNIDYFAVEIGCYASDLDAKSFEKVPPPELCEIEENESDSISTNSVKFLMTLRRRTKT